MSDAPRSSDSGKPELDPPPRHAGLRLSEVSTMAAAMSVISPIVRQRSLLSEGCRGALASSPTHASHAPLADHVTGAGILQPRR